MKYNSSTSQEITVSCVKALESSEPMQAAIATLTNAPATIDPAAQPIAAPNKITGGATTINKEQAGEQNNTEVVHTA